MKIAKLLLPVLLLLFACHNAIADEQTYRQLADELIVLTDLEQLMDNSFSRAKETQMQRLDMEYRDLSPEELASLKKKVGEYLDSQLRFARVRDDFARVYMEFFTEEELQTIVDFYKSPAVQKLKENDRELKMMLMKATQEEMQDLNFQIKKIKDEFAVELEEKKAASTGKTSGKQEENVQEKAK